MYEVEKSSVIAPNRFNNISVLRDDNGFHVFNDNKCQNIAGHDVEPLLRNMKAKQLRQFINAGGKIKASKLDNGDFVLRSYVPGKGGGKDGLMNASLGVMVFGTIASVAAGTATGILTLNPAFGFGAALAGFTVTLATARGLQIAALGDNYEPRELIKYGFQNDTVVLPSDYGSKQE